MIVQHYKNTCLVCGTSWGVDKNSRRISALYSVSSTLNPLNADAVQDDTAVTRTVQGLHSDQWMSGCPNCGVENFRQEDYFIEEGVEEENIPAEKPCPVCAENVKIAAVKCRYCGHDFGEQAVRAASEAVDEAVERIRARQAELRERFVEQEHCKKEIRIAKSVGSVCIIAELIGLFVIVGIYGIYAASPETAAIMPWLFLGGFFAIIVTAGFQRRRIGLRVMLNREKSRRAGADTAEGRPLEGDPAAENAAEDSTAVENPAGASVLKDNST